MAFRIPGIRKASLSASKGTNVPKGYLAVYVGDKMRRFVIPHLEGMKYGPACRILAKPFNISRAWLNKSWIEGWFKYETGITNRFCFSPTYTARCPFGTSTDFEAAWLPENDDVLRITGIRRATKSNDVPKGYLAVYVGDKMRRFLIPVSYLNQPLFQELLNQAEEEFGYDHPNGGLTIPCREDEFLNLTSQLSRL
ncbi:hypothetical protein AHAS_Ahas13G0081600 [Arachis hypogaea]